MKNTRIFPMRRLPGPASSPLCDGVKTPEAPVELFRGWQRTQTQSSVRTLRGLRQQMDVWFCLMQESSAERHRCVTADPDQTNCAPSGARPEILCFSLDFDLHRGELPANESVPHPEVHNALLGQRKVFEDRGRSFTDGGLGADPHPDRRWVVIFEEANQLPVLLVERGLGPDICSA